LKCLIDTHTLLWIITNDPKLSNKAKDLYLNSKNTIYFSLASLWEMAIKVSLKKLFIDENLKEFVQNHIKGNDINILNIELPHIFLLEKLPYHHRDPFDRLLVCQSSYENMPILSSDKVFDFYDIKRIW